jgi:hypothetical protein
VIKAQLSKEFIL